jgi:hypothetical protein
MENLKKFKDIIFLALALLIFVFLYNNTTRRFDRLEGQHDILKEEYSKKKGGVIVSNKKYVFIVDSIKKEIYKKDFENKALKDSNKNLEEKIASILNSPKKLPKDLAGLVAFYNQRYSTSKNTAVGDKVGLEVETAMDVSSELEEGDRLAEVLPLKDKQLKNLDTTVVNLNNQKKMLAHTLLLSEEQIKEYQELQKLADQNILNLEKQNKNLKMKNVLNKILIPAAVVGGVFLGTKIK